MELFILCFRNLNIFPLIMQINSPKSTNIDGFDLLRKYHMPIAHKTRPHIWNKKKKKTKQFDK